MLIALALESLPVVDIDNTLFLQALLFLFLLAVLNFVLFQPWLAVKERRTKRIGGAVEDAAELRERASAAERDYASRLAKARDEAMSIRSDRRRQADDAEASIVGDARREAAASLDARKQALSREVEQARTELGERVDSLARDITSQVLGRTA